MSILNDEILECTLKLNEYIKLDRAKKLMIEIKIGNTSFVIHPNDKDETVPQLEVYTWKRQ